MMSALLFVHKVLQDPVGGFMKLYRFERGMKQILAKLVGIPCERVQGGCVNDSLSECLLLSPQNVSRYDSETNGRSYS